MSKDTKALDNLVDFVKQLRRHVEGRRALHIRMSALERHFREEHYRLFAASALRGVIQRYGATMFALPNADLVLITKDARVDDIDPSLVTIRRKMRDSAVLAAIDPVQGVSDNFAVWFDLEADYDKFRTYVDQLCSFMRLGVQGANDTAEITNDEPEVAAEPTTATPPANMPTESNQSRPKPSRIRMVPVTPPSKEILDRELDPELLLTLCKAMQGADVAGLLRKQFVKAVIGDAPPMSVLEHKFVPQALIYETLLTSRVQHANHWLEGYLDDLVARQVLLSTPSMPNETSLATSLKVTSGAVLSSAFDQFDRSVGQHPRSKVVLEFGAVDAIANPVQYLEASRQVVARGYRIAIGDLHPLAFLALDVEPMRAAFVKIVTPSGPIGDWLNSTTEMALHNKVERVGRARVILGGCDTSADIDLGRLLGITLFQGPAIDPIHVA